MEKTVLGGSPESLLRGTCNLFMDSNPGTGSETLMLTRDTTVTGADGDGGDYGNGGQGGWYTNIVPGVGRRSIQVNPVRTG